MKCNRDKKITLFTSAESFRLFFITSRASNKTEPAIITQIKEIRTGYKHRKLAAIFYYEAQASNKTEPAIITQIKEIRTADQYRKLAAIFL